MSEPGFIAQVNEDLLYRDPDGREGFITFNAKRGLAYFGPDINQPDFLVTVGYDAATLRRIADRLDRMSE